MKIIEGGKVPIYSWCPDLEPQALEQMKVIADLPFVYHHVALMPDSHLGNNMCIGGVVACKDVVVPDFVGSDCGCGVCTIKTSLRKEDLMDREFRKRILHSFTRSIPVGFSHNDSRRKDAIKEGYIANVDHIINESRVVNATYSPFTKGTESDLIYGQLGTLGGGNHWASIEYDENGNVWILLHSGSRNIGKQLNDYFDEIAINRNQKWHTSSSIPFLPVGTQEGDDYLKWMDFALRFAFLNRQVMTDMMRKDLEYAFPNTVITYGNMINIHHNYAALEHHMGQNVYIHRKGATLAVRGRNGIIPGSQGTATFITTGVGEEDGKGNPLSFYSSSHGAGRKMGRKEFNRQYNTTERLEQIRQAMADVVYIDFSQETSRGKKQSGLLDVSECPFAYKDIMEVMNNQADLVKPVTKLMPLINMKA